MEPAFEWTVFAAAAAGAAAGPGAEPGLGAVLSEVPPSVAGDVFSALSLAGAAYGAHGFAGMFRSYPFSHAEEDIVMEGTAKIGLSNDGPSPYIDLVDSTLFGPATKGKPHAGGCECSGCSPHFEGIRSGVLAARKKKQATAKAAKEEAPAAR